MGHIEHRRKKAEEKQLSMKPICLLFLGLMACGSYEVDPSAFIQIGSTLFIDMQGDIDEYAEISDLAIYVDAKYLGTFPRQTRVPFIGEGAHNLQIFPIIRANSLSTFPVVYPFYDDYEIPVNLEVANTTVINPRFTYKENSIISFSEDFQLQNIFNIDLDQDPKTAPELISGLDERALLLAVTENAPILETTHSFPINDLPVDGSAAYLELDIWARGTGLFVGIKGNETGGTTAQKYKVYIYPSENRKRQYIEFSPELKSSQFTGYQILFKVIWDDQAGENEQSVLLDNIKFLHF